MSDLRSDLYEELLALIHVETSLQNFLSEGDPILSKTQMEERKFLMEERQKKSLAICQKYAEMKTIT